MRCQRGLAGDSWWRPAPDLHRLFNLRHLSQGIRMSHGHRAGLDARGIAFRSMNVGCLGLCYAEPLIYIKKPNRPLICYGNLHADNVARLVEEVFDRDNLNNDLALGSIDLPEINVLPVPGLPSIWDHPMIKPQVRIALRNCGLIDPEDVKQYLAQGGYSALAKALD